MPGKSPRYAAKKGSRKKKPRTGTPVYSLTREEVPKHWKIIADASTPFYSDFAAIGIPPAEVIQIAHAAVLKNVHHYNPARGAVGTWVPIVVETGLRDFLKNSIHRIRLTQSENIRALSDSGALHVSPIETSSEVERADLINRLNHVAHKMLSANQYAVYLLAFVRGAESHEIARRLNITVSAVNQIKKRIVQTLRGSKLVAELREDRPRSPHKKN